MQSSVPRGVSFAAGFAVVAALTLALLAGVSSGATPKPAPKPAKGKPITFLYFGATTGNAATFAPNVNVYRDALADINKHGGVNGRPLAVTIVDDQLVPAQSAALYNQYAAKAPLIIAITGSEISALGPLAARDHIPLLTEATDPVVVASGRPYVWSVTPNAAQTGAAAARAWVRAEPAVARGKVAVIYQQGSPFSLGQVIPARDYLNSHNVTAQDVTYAAGTTDFSSVVTKARSLNPTGVIISAIGNDAVSIKDQLNAQGMGDVSVLLDPTSSSGGYLSLFGNKIVGDYSWSYYWSQNPRALKYPWVQQFPQLYQGNPATAAAFMVWDMFHYAARVMAKAHVEKIRSLNAQRAALQRLIPKMGVNRIDGRLSYFGADGLMPGSGFLVQVAAKGGATTEKLVSILRP